MAIENFEEVKKYLEDNKDSEEVKTIFTGFIPKEGLDGYLESDDGKKLVQPKLDKHFTKSLETWKANNFKKELEAEISKRFPAETEEQKALRALQDELASMKNQTLSEQLKNTAVKALNEKGLPIKLADYFKSDTQEGMNEIVNAIELEWKKVLEIAVNEKIKGKTPPSPITPPKSDMTKAKLLAMPMAERVKFYTEHKEEFDKIMNS